MSTIARDLPNGDRPYQVAPPEFEYLFLKNGDPRTFILTRFYKQTIVGYNADRLAAKYMPGIDADTEYTDAYLIGETKPSRTRTGMCEFTRTFARIPAQQIVPSWIRFPQPSPLGSGFLVTYSSGVIATSSPVPGGWSDDLLFGLGKVYGPTKAITAEAVSGSNRRLTITGHGFTAGQDLWVGPDGGGRLIIIPSSLWSIVDANTIDILGASSFEQWPQRGGAGQYLRDYTPGSRLLRCKRITDYYLPGISSGIATADDIPLPTDESDAAAFFAAYASGAGTLNIEVGELKQWRESPILEITRTTIAVADLL